MMFEGKRAGSQLITDTAREYGLAPGFIERVIALEKKQRDNDSRIAHLLELIRQEAEKMPQE